MLELFNSPRLPSEGRGMQTVAQADNHSQRPGLASGGILNSQRWSPHWETHPPEPRGRGRKIGPPNGFLKPLSHPPHLRSWTQENPLRDDEGLDFSKWPASGVRERPLARNRFANPSLGSPLKGHCSCLLGWIREEKEGGGGFVLRPVPPPPLRPSFEIESGSQRSRPRESGEGM